MRRLAALTVASVAFHVLMEWLFFVTKPSFLAPLSKDEKALIPWVASAPLFAAALALLLVLALVARTGPRAEKACLLLARGVPALVLAATLLLLIDNFTRTLFGWGSGSLEGIGKAVPLLLFALLAFLSWRWMGSWMNGIAKSRVFQAAALILVLCSAGAAVANTAGTRAPDILFENAGAAAYRPNILLLGSDGLNANRTSLFGYERDTTPFLVRFAREALVFENAFPNGASTASSTTSMLAGRLPTETGVIFPPDVAKGDAAHLHLPGLLRRLGYRTGQFTIRWYADAADFNLQGAFDWANSRSTSPRKGIPGDIVLDRLGQMSAYFLSQMRGRLEERLLPLSSAAPQQNPFRVVHDNTIAAHGDERRLRELFRFIDESDKPFFAHVHLMGTHGHKFKPRQRIYSLGKAQKMSWMPDFYDDAVVDFDRSFEEVVTFLRGRGLLDRTIVVLYSDHGANFTTLDQLPLLFRFPGGARAGRVPENVQNLDIAPTLLDALGIEAPPWMGGTSLLRGRPDPCRWIVSARYNNAFVKFRATFWTSAPQPPWYTLRSLTVLSGNAAVALDLPEGKMETSRIEAGGDACPPLDPEQVRSFLLDHLETSGYLVR